MLHPASQIKERYRGCIAVCVHIDIVTILELACACTTKEFSSLNSRAKECLSDIYKLSYGVIQSLLADIRPYVSSLYAMVESIALLDMLLRCAYIGTGQPAQLNDMEILVLQILLPSPLLINHVRCISKWQ